MESSRSFFPFGASYYGEAFTKNEWETDLSNMRELGFNVFRIAELYLGWEWLQPKPDLFHFDELDEIVRIANRNSLKVILGIGTCSPPPWIFAKYPDVRYVADDGTVHRSSGVWPTACHNHPGFMAEAERFVKEIVTHYRDDPALYAWQLDNERRYPRRTGEEKLYCYCHNTILAFQDWLKRKYSSLDLVNRLWRTRYSSWDEIEPAVRPIEGGNVPAWIDWRIFSDENISDFVRWEAGLVKSLDSKHLLMTNMVPMEYEPAICHVILGEDYWKLGESVDALGLDIYPRWKVSFHPSVVSEAFDLARSSARGKQLWAAELQGGPTNAWFNLYTPSASDVRRWTWSALASGIKGAIYYHWRFHPVGAPWYNMQIPFQGLCNPDGSLSERVLAAGEIAKVVSEYGDFFSSSSPPTADVAILYSRTTHISAYGEGVVDAYFDSIKGTYRALWQNHVSVDFLTPKELVEGGLEKFRLLLMPFSYTLNDMAGVKVGEFVQKGGTVFADARCALTDDHGWLHYPIPGAGLSEVFGASERSVASTPNVEMKMSSASPHLAQSQGKVMVGAGFKEVLEPQGSEVLGEFDWNEPAIVLNRYGLGHAVLAGSYLGLAYMRYENPIFRLFVRDLLSISGAEERLKVETVPGDLDDWIEAKALETSDSAMIFLINHSDQLANIDLTFKSGKSFKKALNVLNKEEVALEPDEGFSRFRRKIEAGECAITLLRR